MRNTIVEDPSPPNDLERLITRVVSTGLIVFALSVSYFFWSRQIRDLQQTVIEGRMTTFARDEGKRYKPREQFARPESIVSGQ